MKKVYLAMYKGPGDQIHHKVFHYGTCVWTLSRYSHCELLIDNLCYSSSARDSGVRSKSIPNLHDSGKWDIFYLPSIDAEKALDIFYEHVGKKYDYLGVARHVVPFIPNIEDRMYCSELVSAMCSLPQTEKTPEDVFRTLVVNYTRKIMLPE